MGNIFHYRNSNDISCLSIFLVTDPGVVTRPTCVPAVGMAHGGGEAWQETSSCLSRPPGDHLSQAAMCQKRSFALAECLKISALFSSETTYIFHILIILNFRNYLNMVKSL